MREKKKAVALERMRILIANASANIAAEPGLAARQAEMAQKIQMHHRVKMPYDIRISICRKCKTFTGYGTHSRIRLVRKTVLITCGYCGHVNRKILPK